jgi:hypothetical protein
MEIMKEQENKSNSSDGEQCCICLMSLKNDEVELECGHILHRKCLHELLISSHKKKQKVKCPLCRIDLTNYIDLDSSQFDRYIINVDQPQISTTNTNTNLDEQVPLLTNIVSAHIENEEQRRRVSIKRNIFAGLFLFTIFGCVIIFTQIH